MKNVVVVGCGASGMMAAIQLARKGHSVTIVEKNEKPGKKLFITGKGRCNLTNNCDEETFLKNMVSNPKFMYSAIYNFNPAAVMDFFESLGLRLKTERGNRVFPVSDHSSDVISVLARELKKLNVEVKYETRVSSVKKCDDDKFILELCSIDNNIGRKSVLTADAVVIATGGKSYRLTGSTGDGYKFAEDFGLKVNTPHPALVPLEVKNELCKRLMGLSLKNVSVSFKTEIKGKKKLIYEAFGEMLFTHFGVSGPIILSASSIINKYLNQGVDMYIDFKPAVSREQLDERLLREFSENRNKNLKNAISDMLPKSLIPELIDYAGLDAYKKVNEIKKEERERLLDAFKSFHLEISCTRDFDEAIITQGGIKVSEVSPQTMECKKIPGLYFIGEVLDLDAFTGGFNLQIAWSTAMALDLCD
jgi:hypothetical protein